MSYRYDEFAAGEVYHIYTRGVESRHIFSKKSDWQRFSDLLQHCLPRGPIKSFSIAKRFHQKPARTEQGDGLVDLLCYCLMTNHVHLLLQENVESGISQYMQRLLNSYARYFNVLNRRSGSLFLHPFRAVLVEQDEQLLHVSRYIHLNPYSAHMIGHPMTYRWSSLSEYIKRGSKNTCHTSLIRTMMTSKEYRTFVADEADYTRSLKDIQHLLVDLEP